MNILAWLVFGLIVGVIANMISPKESSGGIISAVILGIVGSIVGGFLGNLIFGVNLSGFNLGSFIIAVSGSLAIVFISRKIVENS